MLQTTDNDGGMGLIPICLIDNELFCRLGTIQFPDNPVFSVPAKKLFRRESVRFLLLLFKRFLMLSIL